MAAVWLDEVHLHFYSLHNKSTRFDRLFPPSISNIM